MDKPKLSVVISMQACYVAIGMILIALRLMPLHTLPRYWPGPDVLTLMTFAWVLRRPEQVSPLLIAVVMLTADLLLGAAPGLWAALVLFASEVLRGRGRSGRPLGFGMEWGLVAILLGGITVAGWLALTVTLAPHATLLTTVHVYAVTVAAYPLVALVFRLAGMRRRDYPQGVIRMARP